MYDKSEIPKYPDPHTYITGKKKEKPHFSFVLQNQFALGKKDTFIGH